MKKLGVVVPAYNSEKYISKCIESILGQTYKNIELVLVDDGSTDNTASIAEEYECINSNMHIIRQENAGPIKARHAGIKALEDCEYVTFVDSDDWIDKRMYEDLMSFIEQHSPDLVISGINRYHDEDYIIASHDTIEEGYIDFKSGKSVADCFGYGANSTSVDASLWSKIFRREKLVKVYEKAENLNIHYGEDIAIVYPYIMLCDSMYCTYKAYYYHRIRKGIASYAKGEDYFEKLLRLYNHLLGCFREDKDHFPKLLEELDYCFIVGAEFRKTLYKTAREGESRYLFPFGKVKQGERIVIFGLGNVGRGYVEQIAKTDYCNIVATVDRYSGEADFHTPEDLKKIEFDHIIIAMADEGTKRQIVKELVATCEMPREKIIDETIRI